MFKLKQCIVRFLLDKFFSAPFTFKVHVFWQGKTWNVAFSENLNFKVHEFINRVIWKFIINPLKTPHIFQFSLQKLWKVEIRIGGFAKERHGCPVVTRAEYTLVEFIINFIINFIIRFSHILKKTELRLLKNRLLLLDVLKVNLKIFFRFHIILAIRSNLIR